MKIKFVNDHVETDEQPKSPKKITGTRFGAVLSANRWQSPFQAWCEITKAYVKPFEETIYTKAGKVIEDKQLTWFEDLAKVIRPEAMYGKDFFKKTRGDFFHDVEIFGGMWDSVTCDDSGIINGVIECKTTKRAEDWMDDIPEYYALQAALYAHLLNVDDVYMIISFLDESDYDHPEDYVCTARNTTYRHFKVSERYPEFARYINFCELWWEKHVVTGISPDYDEKEDAEYLQAMRTHVVDTTTDMSGILEEAEMLYSSISTIEDSIKADKKRLTEIEGLLKDYAIEHEGADQDKTVFKGSKYTWTLSKTTSTTVDTDKMKKDGIYNQYLKEKVTYTMRKNINKEGDNV